LPQILDGPRHLGTARGAAFGRSIGLEPPPLPPEVPRALARVVAKAMENEPSARYESAAALADDLASLRMS
jgi:serine/threonine-protein kinase